MKNIHNPEDANLRSISGRIPESLYNEIKHYSREKDIKMKLILKEAINDYLWKKKSDPNE